MDEALYSTELSRNVMVVEVVRCWAGCCPGIHEFTSSRATEPNLIERCEEYAGGTNGHGLAGWLVCGREYRV